MTNNSTAIKPYSYKMLWLNENSFGNAVYSDTNSDIHKREMKRFRNIYEVDVAEQFNSMQKNIMKKEIPVLSKLLSETPFETGYESVAERYYNRLWTEYGIIADTVLQNIYLQNMYGNHYLIKHLLFIVGNLPADRRENLEIVPLAGLSNPDIEIQDLSVKCFEAWEDKRHLPTLISMRDKTNVQWFKDYINDVIEALSEE